MNFIRNRNFRAGPQTSLEGFICPQNSDKQQKIKVFGRSEGGAHARHYNAHSIGICYEGGLDEKGKPADTRTPAQKDSLEDLLYGLSLDYPDAEILGHRDLPWVRKSCPCFDVKEWLKEIDFHL